MNTAERKLEATVSLLSPRWLCLVGVSQALSHCTPGPLPLPWGLRGAEKKLYVNRNTPVF